MASKNDKTMRIEAVEQLEEIQIDLKVVHWFAGEKLPSIEQKQFLSQLWLERGASFYSDILFVLLGQRYPNDDAKSLWNKLIAHRDSLAKSLGRNPGIVVAALDWQTNFQNQPASISLIESSKLENIRENSVIDGLTGLFDHTTILTLLEKELERSTRFSEKCSVLMLDLDDFKEVNDNYGHKKGDQVLITLAKLMRDNLRTIDTLGRYGGEEFIPILPETDISSAILSAERLREAVEKQFNTDLSLTISVGISNFPAHATTVDALIKHADAALYKAKNAGKNKVVTFSAY